MTNSTRWGTTAKKPGRTGNRLLPRRPNRKIHLDSFLPAAPLSTTSTREAPAPPPRWTVQPFTYAISKHGLLHAYQGKDGKVIWKKDMMKEAGMKRPPEWGFAASPYVLGDQLIIEAGATYSLNKKNGEIIWKSKTYRPAYGTPTHFKPGGKSMIAVLKTDGLVLLDPKNGKTLAFEKWETSYRTNASTPIVQGDKIIISTGYQRGCAALFNGRKENFKNSTKTRVLSTHMNHAILADGFLYGFDGNVHMAGKKDFVCMEFLKRKGTMARFRPRTHGRVSYGCWQKNDYSWPAG